jgi:glutaminyl-peptide cyclotransferase
MAKEVPLWLKLYAMRGNMRTVALVLICLAGVGLILPNLPLGLLKGCRAETDNPTGEPEVPADDKLVAVPDFERDSAYNNVQKQVDFGPRVVGQAAHKACAAWLQSQLTACGAMVTPQKFTANLYTGKSFEAVNIIGSFNPQATDRIVLAAHWDSRHQADQDDERQTQPILGADDGGSGVGVLLEVARQLKNNPLSANLGIDIVLFDAEDHGNGQDRSATGSETWCLGSQYWAKTPHTPGYKARFGILLDMVGSRGATFPQEEVSLQYATNIVDLVWAAGRKLGYTQYFLNDKAPGITDDHLFVNQVAHIPMIDIINRPQNSQTGFGHYWHTHDDNMSIIDRDALKAVGQTLLYVIYHEAAKAK